jgi:tRNA(Ile)-lysidine synthase
MMQNTENLKNASAIFNNHIEKTTRDIVIKNGNQYKISIDKLNNLPEKQTWLFEFLNKFGFSFDNVVNIISKLNTNAGKQFFSNTHQLLIDRDYLLIEEQNKSNRNFIANNISELSELPVNISVSVVEPENFILDKNQLTANIDLDKIKFPVSIRKWQDGDYFYPLGMNKKKKLSDFFIDNKINRFAKDKTWIFSDAENRIFWVGGLRIDNRFKVTDNTKNILILHL